MYRSTLPSIGPGGWETSSATKHQSVGRGLSSQRYRFGLLMPVTAPVTPPQAPASMASSPSRISDMPSNRPSSPPVAPSAAERTNCMCDSNGSLFRRLGSSWERISSPAKNGPPLLGVSTMIPHVRQLPRSSTRWTSMGSLSLPLAKRISGRCPDR